jgi:chemotaxis protein methyltransferase CheR
VLELFRDSLVRSGFLCLGTKESLAETRLAADFALFNAAANIWRTRAVRGA